MLINTLSQQKMRLSFAGNITSSCRSKRALFPMAKPCNINLVKRRWNLWRKRYELREAIC